MSVREQVTEFCGRYFHYEFILLADVLALSVMVLLFVGCVPRTFLHYSLSVMVKPWACSKIIK